MRNGQAFVNFFRTAIFLTALACGMLRGQAPATGADQLTTLRTSVRRVVLDVIVTDEHGHAIHDLSKEDFQVMEDHVPQTVLSFDGNGFKAAMDYAPPALPAEPPNTFVNLPPTPESGPLYVLLYDLVNIDDDDQMAITSNDHSEQTYGRAQLVKFIESKPAGARFAIFVRSDGLHLLCGFTSDKARLYAAIDPHSSRPHIPEIFLMGDNFGRGDVHETVGIFHSLARYLAGMPGRKNLIWFSSKFPLSFYPDQLAGTAYAAQVKSTLNMLAHEQIAVYPVDVRGVVIPNAKGSNGLAGGGEIVSAKHSGAAANAGGSVSSGAGPALAAGKGSGAGEGPSLISASYNVMDEIAKETGGRAFYSSNDVVGSLDAAVDNGASYYTLTYSSTDKEYDGRLRHIEVKLEGKNYQLQYRRSYFATVDDDTPRKLTKKDQVMTVSERSENDGLNAAMRHGAPPAHALIFGLHVTPGGTSRGQGKGGQHLTLEYTVMTHQLNLSAGKPARLELASTTYDADGNMLSETINRTDDSGVLPAAAPSTGATPAKSYRMEQELDAPPAAHSLRVAVRDLNTERIGAMEIALPLEAAGR